MRAKSWLDIGLMRNLRYDIELSYSICLEIWRALCMGMMIPVSYCHCFLFSIIIIQRHSHRRLRFVITISTEVCSKTIHEGVVATNGKVNTDREDVRSGSILPVPLRFSPIPLLPINTVTQ